MEDAEAFPKKGSLGDSSEDALEDDVSWSDIEDDFDSEVFEDDFSEAVPDDSLSLDEPVIAPVKSKRKKGGSLGMVFTIAILAGLGGGGYYLYNTSSLSGLKQVVIPTIQTTGGNSPSIQNDETASLSESGIGSPGVESVNDSLQTPALEQEVSIPEPALVESNEVLTPMPDSVDTSSIELSSLDEPILRDTDEDAQILDEPQVALNSFSESAPDDQIDLEEGRLPLEEDKLLLETNKPSSQTIENEIVRPEANSELGVLETTEEEIAITQESEIVTEVAPSLDDLLEPEGALVDSEVTVPSSKISSVAQGEEMIESIEGTGDTSAPPISEETITEVLATESPVEMENVQEVEADQIIEQPKEIAQPPAKVEKPARVWKLRSAKPGSAVLYDQRYDEMKTVEIGDTVSGLGKITSISNSTGKWVVEGTKGRVQQ